MKMNKINQLLFNRLKDIYKFTETAKRQAIIEIEEENEERLYRFECASKKMAMAETREEAVEIFRRCMDE